MTYTPKHAPPFDGSRDPLTLAHRSRARVLLWDEQRNRAAFHKVCGVLPDDTDPAPGRHRAPDGAQGFQHDLYIRLLDDATGSRFVRYAPRPKLKLPVTNLFGFDFWPVAIDESLPPNVVRIGDVEVEVELPMDGDVD